MKSNPGFSGLAFSDLVKNLAFDFVLVPPRRPRFSETSGGGP